MGGGVSAAVGAAIHAATALAIARGLGAPTARTPVDPLAGLAAPRLVALWCAAGLGFAVASAALTVCAIRGTARWTLASPLACTLARGALGARFARGRLFLLPAARNLAHLAFFALGARVARGAAPNH